jgi:hypothetical protein
METQLKGFRQTIEEYLAALALRDASFAERYCNPAKKVDDCITYIINQVQKSGLHGFDDSEIYALAVHYYVEDNIDPGTPVQCQVIVNHHVELTEEEIAEQRRKAKEEVFSLEVQRLRNTGKVSPAQTPKVEEQQMLLF